MGKRTQPATKKAAPQLHVRQVRKNADVQMERVLALCDADIESAGGGEGLAEYRSTASPDRAAPLPVSGLQGTPRSILRQHGSATTAILFDAINGFRDLAERARKKGDLYVETTALSQAAKTSLKCVELLISRQVNLNVAVANQSHIPNWEDLPQTVRDEVDQHAKQLAEQTVIDVVSK